MFVSLHPGVTVNAMNVISAMLDDNNNFVVFLWNGRAHVVKCDGSAEKTASMIVSELRKHIDFVLIPRSDKFVNPDAVVSVAMLNNSDVAINLVTNNRISVTGGDYHEIIAALNITMD